VTSETSVSKEGRRGQKSGLAAAKSESPVRARDIPAVFPALRRGGFAHGCHLRLPLGTIHGAGGHSRQNILYARKGPLSGRSFHPQYRRLEPIEADNPESLADAEPEIDLVSLRALCASCASFQRFQISCSANLGWATAACGCKALDASAASAALAAGARARQPKTPSQGIRFIFRLLIELAIVLGSRCVWLLSRLLLIYLQPPPGWSSPQVIFQKLKYKREAPLVPCRPR
jgi:hypothetical protein